MGNLKVQKTGSVKDRSLPMFREIDELMEKIRVRAYDLFRSRGSDDGRDLDDWLQAEREFCWPAAELEEDDKHYTARIALAGFDADEIELTANPREIVAKAHHEASKEQRDEETLKWSELHSRDVLRRIALPEEIDVDDIDAKLKHGMLEIRARKAKGRSKKSKTVDVKKAG